ncbi:hypothetical protein ACFV4J_49665 [Streptomyces mirabilis]|uniref:hypothetical protein n=1 Tax=Streptomyces mirabilis TaxID=68239 RepID=UPI00366A2B21
MTTDLNTLLTALYVKIDNEIGGTRCIGRPHLLSDSELVCLAVAQAVLGSRSEARWRRFAHAHLRGTFPRLSRRPGYNKRLRAALPLVKRAIRLLAADTACWFDNVWITDSTPVECGRSRPTVKRSDRAGWAAYGYCRSHSRYGSRPARPVADRRHRDSPPASSGPAWPHTASSCCGPASNGRGPDRASRC